MEIVTIKKVETGCYSICYEWSQDIDPNGFVAACCWRLSFLEAWQQAKRELHI